MQQICSPAPRWQNGQRAPQSRRQSHETSLVRRPAFAAKVVVDVVPAALASLVGGFLLTQYQFGRKTVPPTATAQAGPASAEMMQLVRDEHAAIIAYLKAQTAARQKRYAAEDDANAQAAAAAAARVADAAPLPLPQPQPQPLPRRAKRRRRPPPRRLRRASRQRLTTRGRLPLSSRGGAVGAAGDCAGAAAWRRRTDRRGSVRVELSVQPDPRHRGSRRARHPARGVCDRQYPELDRLMGPRLRRRYTEEFDPRAIRRVVVSCPRSERDGRPHEVALAELDPAMTQDVVSGGAMEIEIRQRIPEQQRLSGKVAGRAARERDLYRACPRCHRSVRP